MRDAIDVTVPLAWKAVLSSYELKCPLLSLSNCLKTAWKESLSII